MFKSNHLFTSLLVTLLALTLVPFSALAVTENVLESAPEVSMPEEDADDTYAETPEETVQEDNYRTPSLSVLPERGTVQESEELNLPRLTDAELATVQELLAARKAGEQADFDDRHYADAEKVFGAGVYPLDPADFNGNTFYVILPYRQMSKNELLSLISAFEGLGIPFDPDSLNSTNCVRGTSLLYHAATRDLSYEEQNRMEEMQRQIRRGVLDRESFTPVSTCRSVLVQMPGYSHAAYDYLEPFCFYPYRDMTDDELATFAFAQEVKWEIHPDQLEKKARECAHKVFPLPLSMTAREETRYAYSEDYIEFRHYFRIDSENSNGLYASANESPYEVMVEQDYSKRQGEFPAEASVVRILIDYPAMYSGRTDDESRCSEEELKASARKWAEKYLLVPKEDILSDWVFDERFTDWGSVQYRLLTTEWLVCLEMSENNAGYMQCCIYDRDYAVEFDDWDQAASGETAGAEGTEWDFDQDTIDQNARLFVRSLLNLPQDMTTENISRNTDGYVQYRSDYIFQSDEKNDSSDRNPGSMIVYQTPFFSKEKELSVECLFLSYPSRSDDAAEQLSDEEYVASAREWAEKTLLVSGEETLKDWSREDSSTSWSVTYRLETNDWVVFLQMQNDGKWSWCGIYPRGTVQ